MDLELDPRQPDEVLRAVRVLSADDRASRADPWWQAGIEEALSVSAGELEPLLDQGEATARPRSTPGAARA
jgi:hypothetical protein